MELLYISYAKRQNNKGVDGLKEFTPWKMFIKTINHERYNSFDGKMLDFFSTI